MKCGGIMINNIIEDSNIKLPKTFIKFGKKEHMISLIKNGRLHLEPSKTFSKSNKVNDAVYDNFDGSIYYNVHNLNAFPLIDEEKYIYGKGIKLATKSELKIRNTYNDKIPIYCLYKYDYCVMNSIMKLNEKLLNEFYGYDYAVIILEPLKFLNQIKVKKGFYANSVIYTNATPFETEITNKIHYLYYKKEAYSYQNEFRISIVEEQIDVGYEFEIGSILEYSIMVPVEALRKGVLIAESYEKGLELIGKYEKEYNIKFGECVNLE